MCEGQSKDCAGVFVLSVSYYYVSKLTILAPNQNASTHCVDCVRMRMSTYICGPKFGDA